MLLMGYLMRRGHVGAHWESGRENAFTDPPGLCWSLLTRHGRSLIGFSKLWNCWAWLFKRSHPASFYFLEAEWSLAHLMTPDRVIKPWHKRELWRPATLQNEPRNSWEGLLSRKLMRSSQTMLWKKSDKGGVSSGQFPAGGKVSEPQLPFPVLLAW